MSNKNAQSERKKEVTVQGRTFKTKTALKKACKEIKDRFAADGVLSDEDKGFILEVLRHHHEWYKKCSCESPELSLGRAIKGTVCWYICCKNSNPMHIKVDTGIDGIFGDTDPMSKALNAFRNTARQTVDSQIQKFRNAVLNRDQIVCEESEVVLSADTLHIDHKPPKYYDNLLFEFCKSNAINPLQESIGRGSGGKLWFINQTTKNAWLQYHSEHAELRPISADLNLKLPKPTNPWKDYINEFTENKL